MLGIIILAAGKSRRMKSKTSKIFHELAGKKVIEHVIDSVKTLQPQQIVIVTSPDLADHKIIQQHTVAIQDPPLGTAHAVQVAINQINPDCNEILIVCGDAPCITNETLKKLYESTSDLVTTGMLLDNEAIHMPYGRLVCDEKNQVKKIVEYKDGNEKDRLNPIANAGFYKINKDLLIKALSNINNNNANGEFYLTDIVEWCYAQQAHTSLILADYDEAHGINTRHDLVKAEQILQARWRYNCLESGVTLKDPQTTFLSADTVIGEDTEISPFVTFGPNVTIGNNVKILPFCHIEHACIEDNASVGPFAHIRGNAVIGEKASIGNFVEVKGSKFCYGAKAKHLSYIGDAIVGEKTNIGAGTITCNYDGVNKHKTIIGENSRIGANSSLVAPVNIGNNAVIGAGSTITRDVEDNALALGRAQQVTKPDYYRTRKD